MSHGDDSMTCWTQQCPDYRYDKSHPFTVEDPWGATGLQRNSGQFALTKAGHVPKAFLLGPSRAACCWETGGFTLTGHGAAQDSLAATIRGPDMT